jgi:hypothetical protein
MLSLALVGGTPSPATATTTDVATAAIAVGDVQHVSGGQTRRLGLGAALKEGDRIVTGRDGMAILVFVDQARVSLRAESELVISRYRLAETGKPADMQLELVRGAMRQISGDAMRSEPERYRLNTPVAAIGVRGTDFLAKASSDVLETFIQEGAIVLMPLGTGCAMAADSRSCAPISLSTSADPMRYVKLSSSGELQRKGVSAGELEQLFGIKLARSSSPIPIVVALDTSSASTLPAAAAPSSGLASAAAGPAAVSQAPSSPQPPAAPVSVVVTAAPIPPVAPQAAPDPTHASAQETIVRGLVKAADVMAAAPVVTPTKPKDPVTPAAPPAAPVVVEPPAPAPEPVAPAPQPEPPAPSLPMPTQLGWGRSASADAIPVTPNLQLPLSYPQASAGRHVTVGELFEYALWREGSPGSIDKGLRGQVSYSFVTGEAYFQPTGAASATQGKIDSAKLSIDFDQSLFSSAFTVSHAATGKVQIAASGRMNDEGVFAAGTDAERISGAVSKDGTEAGALFRKSIEAGTVRGISLFRRP